MANLALTYFHQGRFQEAKTIQTKVLDGRRRVLGPEYPSTMAVIGNLAIILRSQGMWNNDSTSPDGPGLG